MELLDSVTAKALALPTNDAASNRTELGQNEFLKLMVTQFRNQDPMKPMENGEFLGQLAQFSTVAGIGDMNESVGALADSIRSSQALQAASIVGRDVLVEGDAGLLKDGAGISGAIDLPATGGRATVRVIDGAGRLVREIPMGNTRAGLNNFQWDGLSDDGSRAAAGQYRFTAQLEQAGEIYELPTLIASRVVGVSLLPGSGGAEITTELGDNIKLASVRSIR